MWNSLDQNLERSIQKIERTGASFVSCFGLNLVSEITKFQLAFSDISKTQVGLFQMDCVWFSSSTHGLDFSMQQKVKSISGTEISTWMKTDSADWALMNALSLCGASESSETTKKQASSLSNVEVLTANVTARPHRRRDAACLARQCLGNHCQLDCSHRQQHIVCVNTPIDNSGFQDVALHDVLRDAQATCVGRALLLGAFQNGH